MNNYVYALLGLALFGAGLKIFGSGMKAMAVPEHLEYFIRSPWYMFVGGFLMTILWQSSSLSTTAVVALVASGALAGPDKLPAVIACLIGCNLGTTASAHLAAVFSSSEMSTWYQTEGFRAAMIHTFLNVFMAICLLPFVYPIARFVGRF